jgi:hypothetical protein
MKLPVIIRRVIQPLLGLFGLFIVIVLMINLPIFDESVNPEVAEIMTPEVMSAEKENAYFAIWGLSADSDKDIIKAGTNIINRYRSNRDNNGKDMLFPKDYEDIFGGEGFDKEWLKTYPRCTSRSEYNCLAKMSEQIKANPIFSERLELMLARYQQVIKLTQYQNINDASFATPLPSYSSILRLNQIRLAQLYNLNLNLQFIQQAAADMKFWRMVLTQSRTMIDQMVAVASISNNLQLLSELIQSKKLNTQSINELILLLTPLTFDEIDISEAFIAEAAVMYRHLPVMSSKEIESIFDSNLLPMSVLLQPNATNNKHYEYFLKPVVKLSKQPVEQFYKVVQSNSLNLKENFNVGFSPTNLYNLTGKMLLEVSIWSPIDYIGRMHDLNGMISLVKLQLQLKQSEEVNFEQAINMSPIKNPYTNQAMDFDKESNWLGFKCLDKSSLCKIKL